ncbi:MAG: polyprenyl synthetase family protein [Muribaculaceae bacterium]|nr:polyprenyl synthetase family protein [Muribaculaceae bacterium]
MKTFDSYRDIINNALPTIAIPSPVENLRRPIRYALAGSGKRLRPVLALAIADAFGADERRALRSALAIEVFHNFTLVHDDIMDNSDTRHGRPTVWRRWGIPTAILVGDVMEAMPINMLTDNTDDALTVKVVSEFQAQSQKVIDGQQLDMDLEGRNNATPREYIEMVSLKTGALFGLACSIGALIGGAEGLNVEHLRDYGLLLGIAFQLRDDYLDTYGDPATFGKPIGGDILNDKNTLLRIIALNEAPGKMAAIEDNGLQGEAKIEAVRNVYDSLKLRERGAIMVDDFTQRAIEAARQVFKGDALDFLIDYANNLVGRQK